MKQMVVQILGKVRAKLNVNKDSSKDEIINQAKSLPEIEKLTVGKEIVKEIFVPGKLINFVIR